MNNITAGIVGGAGYTGGETTRLLLAHPNVHLAFVQSRSQDGKAVAAIHKDLVGDTSLTFTNQLPETWPDVLFLCLSHGDSQLFVQKNNIPISTKIIDLGNDFRLSGEAGERTFVYGLPEANREQIRAAHAIANPGCFATAIQLGLLPVCHEKLVTDVYTTGITGSTGAGQRLQATAHFTWRTNNLSPYKTLTHQHLGEIHATLHQLQPGVAVHFVPWRGSFSRGIFISSTFRCSQAKEALEDLFTTFYASHPFVHLCKDMIDLKQVVNTNKCLVHIEKEGDHVTVHSTIDNLVKGASGQAVQNMNIMFGWEETTGLNLKASVF